MGNALGVPISYVFKRTFANEEGIVTGLKEVVAHSYLEYTYKNKGKRLDLYDLYTDREVEDLRQINFIIPPEEDALEYPRTLEHEQDVDSIFFCGFNYSQEKLVVKISRTKKGMASVWLYLKLTNGVTYTLPVEKLYRVPSRTGPESFAAGGLRLRCLQAMRKWRISFSGLLREENPEKGSKTTVYIKFSFIWTASSFLYDLTSDIPTKTFAQFLSKQPWKKFLPDISGISDRFDKYVQAGNMSGTYQLDGEDEHEMYLWGTRKRNMERTSANSSNSETELFAYAHDGEMLYFGHLGSPENQYGILQHGCIVLNNSTGGAVDSMQITRGETGPIVDFKLDTHSWTATFESPQHSLYLNNVNGSTSSVEITPVTLNDQEANGTIVTTYWDDKTSHIVSPKIYLPVIDPSEILHSSLVLKLKQKSCREASLTGGKGASLADLHLISKADGTFSVPNGVVVTSKAYEVFLTESSLNSAIFSLEKTAWKKFPINLTSECEKLSSIIGAKSLPKIIKDAIKKSLIEEFGENLEHTRLAVRSSASGEDSEELSAAGQMKTFLGVKGLDMVFEAVIKCWASQFDYTAVQYKRQNGQQLNSPMAVVVQEMVAAEVAGVMFTCDPVTGNPAKITITANYGIGESVVSATAEPDTIVVSRDHTGNCAVESMQVGGKSTMTIMTDTGVIEEEVSEDLTSQSSLSSNFAKILAELGIMIEDAYGCLMDIEWAISNNRIYLLQARPVTTFDKETDFEIMHEWDSPFRAESEWTTTANVGEVLPGSTTFLGQTTLLKSMEVNMMRVFGKRSKGMMPWSPYYQRGMLMIANHSMFSVLDSLLRFYSGKENMITSAQCIAFCGRKLEDPDMLKQAQRRNYYYPNVFAPRQLCYVLKDMIMAKSNLKRRKVAFPAGTKMHIGDASTVEEFYIKICYSWLSLSDFFRSHYECSFFSLMANVVLLSSLISKGKELDNDTFSDVAYILSNCIDVESVEVPNAIENVARKISESKAMAEQFCAMETREALMWLERLDTPIGIEFRKLLDNHGHRTIKEFDLYTKPWGNDPMPLVKTIQDFVSRPDTQVKTKAPFSVSKTISNLKVPLNWKNRLMMKWVIPFCRLAVGLREGSKSLMINIVNSMRHPYRDLADLMVEEGRLPDAELIYFVSHFELYQLIKTRSPKLIQKAIRRRALHPKMDQLIYPEMMRGPPQPINYEKKETVREATFTMKGIPVSQGFATGLARVATSLEEAAELQSGEILIAYSTDIGWSPYFPMLAGVATELGGLISHGAVVAREYGLPCVVGVHGATLKFNTGDKVMIDGNKGLLCRIDE